MGRLRMATAVIGERQRETHEMRLLITEMHAKAIAGAMPGLARGKKAAKGIAKYAAAIRFLSESKKERKLPSTETLQGLLGGRRSS